MKVSAAAPSLTRIKGFLHPCDSYVKGKVVTPNFVPSLHSHRAIASIWASTLTLPNTKIEGVRVLWTVVLIILLFGEETLASDLTSVKEVMASHNSSLRVRNAFWNPWSRLDCSGKIASYWPTQKIKEICLCRSKLFEKECWMDFLFIISNNGLFLHWLSTASSEMIQIWASPSCTTPFDIDHHHRSENLGQHCRYDENSTIATCRPDDVAIHARDKCEHQERQKRNHGGSRNTSPPCVLKIYLSGTPCLKIDKAKPPLAMTRGKQFSERSPRSAGDDSEGGWRTLIWWSGTVL